MVIRGLFVACACLAVAGVGHARADGPADPTAGVPIVLGDAGDVADSAGAPEDARSTPPGAEAQVETVLVEEGAPADADWTEGSLPLRRCIDEPDAWATYGSIDALALERANTAGPLAVTNAFTTVPGTPVITPGDVRYPVFPGARIFLGRRCRDSGGYEVGYLGIWGMHADAVANSPDGTIALPGQLGLVAGSGFDAATTIHPATAATLNSVECNLFVSRVYEGCREHDPLPWRRSWALLRGSASTADWLLGIRWAGLDETATLDVTALASTPPPVFRTTGYRVTSTSQFVGPQIGHRRRIEWQSWAVEGWAKAALVGSFLSQSQGPVVGPFDLVEIRGPRSGTREGVGMIGDLNFSVVRRLGDHCGLRAGYTLLWLSGVAPAANQWDFTDTPTSGTGVRLDTAFFHGATVGFEASW